MSFSQALNMSDLTMFLVFFYDEFVEMEFIHSIGT